MAALRALIGCALTLGRAFARKSRRLCGSRAGGKSSCNPIDPAGAGQARRQGVPAWRVCFSTLQKKALRAANLANGCWSEPSFTKGDRMKGTFRQASRRVSRLRTR